MSFIWIASHAPRAIARPASWQRRVLSHSDGDDHDISIIQVGAITASNIWKEEGQARGIITSGRGKERNDKGEGKGNHKEPANTLTNQHLLEQRSNALSGSGMSSACITQGHGKKESKQFSSEGAGAKPCQGYAARHPARPCASVWCC